MNIVIVNTNCANLFSIKIVLNKLKYHATVSDNPEIISQSDKLFLPGVGTASVAMQQLKKKN